MAHEQISAKTNSISSGKTSRLSDCALGHAGLGVQLRADEAAAQGIGQGFFDENIGEFADQLGLIAAEIHHAVILRAAT